MSRQLAAALRDQESLVRAEAASTGDRAAYRHGVASVLLHEGVPLPYVFESPGHHTPAFTATGYARALPSAARRRADWNARTRTRPSADRADRHAENAIAGGTGGDEL